MIDIENKVIDVVKNALTSASITATVASTYVETPDSFPWVYIAEEDTTTYKNSLDTGLQERHARIAFTAIAYSNKTPGSKTEAKSIAAVIDAAMQGIKFTRTDYSVSNTSRNVTRVVLRYSAIVQAGVTSGSNTTYQIYRS